MTGRNTGKAIAWSLGAAAAFSLAMSFYLHEATRSRSTGSGNAETTTPTPTTSIADRRAVAARALTSRWAAAVNASDWAAARTALARPLREKLDAEALGVHIAAHAYLATTRDITVLRTIEQRVGNDPATASLSARALLRSNRGTVECKLHFVEEPEGLRIASILVAGTPAL